MRATARFLAYILLAASAACGGTGDDADPADAGSAAVSATAAALKSVGSYAGVTRIAWGTTKWEIPAVVDVESIATGLLRVPLHDACFTAAFVDVAPPVAIVFIYSRSGAPSFALPTGERVLLDSVLIEFDLSAGSLVMTSHGTIDGADIQWTFTGKRTSASAAPHGT